MKAVKVLETDTRIKKHETTLWKVTGFEQHTSWKVFQTAFLREK